MSEDPPLTPAARSDVEHPSRRLLKTWQDAELVRRMDAVIIASRGAYADRSEFLAEAIGDRLEAEEERLGGEPANGGAPTTTAALADEAGPSIELTRQTTSLPTQAEFCDWLDSDTPALPTASGPQTNFGLHNRDWPTLLAADWLGRLTSDAGQPIPWQRFTDVVTDWAWRYGAELQQEDLDRPRGAKVAAGFPTNRRKREATEGRFREHFLGTMGKRGNQGPMFVFRLIGLDGEQAALSEPGVELMRALQAAGADAGPPFGADAWRAFATHLGEHAREELSTWMRVLAVVADRPDRKALVNRCDWWKGAAADTNSMSLVARGREWGLIELGLDDGRYQLTDLGAVTLRGEREQGAIPA